MEDEEVVFEGTALHEHLKTLNLINANDEHPSFSSREACVSQLSQFEHSSGMPSNEWHKNSLWQQIKFGLYATFDEFKRIKRKFLLIDQLEKEMLSYLGVLVCSKGLLTPDDRLHLYYFSPVFNNLVEEPALINVISEQEAKVTSTLLPSTSFKSKMATVGAVIAVSLALLCGGSGSTLSYAVEDFKDLSYQVAAASSIMWVPLLVLLLVFKGARKVARLRYTRAYRHAKEALLSLAHLQSSCLPPAFSAAADAALLLSPSATSGSGVRERLGCELARLRRLLHDTLRCAMASLAPPPAPLQQSRAQTDEWTQTKTMRRDLELHVSALARDVLLKAVKSDARERLPNSAIGTRVCTDGSPALHVMEALYRSLEDVLPDIQAMSGAVSCQVGLLRHCWLYAEGDKKPRLERACEEVSSATSLTRRVRACLLLLDQIIPDLTEFSSISLPESSEGIEGTSREMIVRKYGNIQEKIASLFEEFKLGQQDLDVLSESLAARKLRLLREPGVNRRLNTDVRLGKNSFKNNSEVPSTNPELHIVPVTPYIAEDEFFEATTEDQGDRVEEATQWDAENEQDEQIRRQVIACNKRVLSELQPILVRKKEEFQQREEKAKQRMRADREGGDCNPSETREKLEVPGSSNEDEIIDGEILNVVDASSALRTAEYLPVSKHKDSTCSLGNQLSSSDEDYLCQLRSSINDSQLQESSHENQFPPENASDESQYRREDSSNLIPSAGVALYNLNKKHPCRGRTDQCLEMTNHGVDHDGSSCRSPSEKLLTAQILNPDVQNATSIRDVDFHGNENDLEEKCYHPPSYYESLASGPQLEPENTIFETAACDSEVPRSPDHVVRHEEFESSPGQDDDPGDSRWNIRVRPRDLKARLQFMMESQKRELSNSDAVSDENLDLGRSSNECNWGFPSNLAAEAVRLSNQFGVEEETFGGMGEGDEEVLDGTGEWDNGKFEDLGKEEMLNSIGEERENFQYEENSEEVIDNITGAIQVDNQTINMNLEKDE